MPMAINAMAMQCLGQYLTILCQCDVCAEYVNVNVVLSCLSQVSTKVCTTFYDVSILALQNFKWHATFHSSRG